MSSQLPPVNCGSLGSSSGTRGMCSSTPQSSMKRGLNHAGKNPYVRWLSRTTVVYTISASPVEYIRRRNVHQVTSELREAGITPGTVMLVWHQSTEELILLRQFLERAGYTRILPPNRTVCRSFTCFVAIFRTHTLVGLNNQALIDCRQSMLVCIGCDELCRPVEQRGDQCRPDTIAKPTESSIHNFYRPLDNGEIIPLF
jgi:hypothetical protein